MGEAAKLGFRLGTHALERFQRQFDDHDARDAVAVGTVMLTAFGLTESLARAMNESLPAVERLNCEWSPPDCEYGLRLAGGEIVRVNGAGGTSTLVDTRLLEYHRVASE